VASNRTSNRQAQPPDVESATMRFAYWGFRCKTEDCNFPLLVTRIGPYDETRQITPITGLGVIEMYCPGCHQRHKYNRNEAQVLIVSEPE